MQVHLVDGTYELFRQFLAPRPGHRDRDGIEVGATRAVVSSIFAMLEGGATHLGVATDHIVESFRNDLWADYKTGEGIDPELFAQFQLLEDALEAAGVAVWAMVELEADDALATAAARWSAAPDVDQVVICTPDKDMAQCVHGTRVVCLDRMRRRVIDETAVVAKFGVTPASIPDWLALVGDSADGYPGVPRWGAKSASALLAHYGHLDAIPDHERQWAVQIRGAAALAASLRVHRTEARLYRLLATLRTDAPLPEALEELRWQGARRAELMELCRELGEDRLPDRVARWRD